MLDVKVSALKNKRETVLCSSTKVVAFEDFMIIGERINPTGHKKLKAALREGNIDYCIKEGIEQAEAGAKILDVNVGLPDIDEYQMMIDVVDALTVAVDTPLQIDSSNAKVLEAGLRRFPGVAIVNSVNGKASSMDKIFPIVKKYGAMVVCLTLDETGIPKSSKARFEIAKKIIERAKFYGIPEENLIIDTLVLTVSAQQKEVLETLKAIEAIKAVYKVKTTLGISNVSYGMPNRPLLTRTFMTLAIAYGLNSAIMDPKDEALKNAILSTRVLMNQDIDGSDYIDHIHTPEKIVEKSSEYDFFDLVLKGYKFEVEVQTKNWLETLSPLAIVNDHLIKTLDMIGQRYEEKSIFLPQLMRAAETIGVAFEVIKSALPDQSEVVSKGKIILATVQGDVHDIGKNLVKMLLENYGFEVIDLGKDVSPEIVLETVIDTGIHLVGLSALMTTTVVSMASTIKLLKNHNPNIKIFVGGAVLTESYAKEIKADNYCKDGKSSVLVAQNYYKNKNKSN